MGEFLVNELKALGASVETRDLGKQDFHGTPLDLPPVVLATVGNDPAKKTILVYGHYDVQPVSIPKYSVKGVRSNHLFY
jgi:Cys-Gly metallodipeptidase DUG1